MRAGQPFARAAEALLRWFSGPDVFISYARADGYGYAARLAQLLTRQRLSVFLDQAGSEPGLQVPASVLRALRRSRVVVVLASPAALQSRAVAEELAQLPAGRTLIPVALGTQPAQWPDWAVATTGLAVHHEPAERLRTARPSPLLARRIAQAVGRWRQAERLQRSSLAAGLLLAAAGLGALALTYRLVDAREELGQATARSALARAEAASAVSATRSANQALDDARGQLARVGQSLAEGRDQLETLNAQLRTQQQRLDAQRVATAAVWDHFEAGLQALYPQPDLACPRPGQVLSLERPVTVYLASDRISLQDNALALLERLARCHAQAMPRPKLLLAGHVSAQVRAGDGEQVAEGGLKGQSAVYALAVSQRLAVAVSRALQARGVPANLIETQAFGHERPAGYPVPAMENRVEIHTAGAR